MSEAIDHLKRETQRLREKDHEFTQNLRKELEEVLIERNELHNTGIEKDVKIKQLMKTNLEM